MAPNRSNVSNNAPKNKLIYNLFYPGIFGSMIYDVFNYTIRDEYIFLTLISKMLILVLFSMDYHCLFNSMTKYENENRDSNWVFDVVTPTLFCLAYIFLDLGWLTSFSLVISCFVFCMYMYCNSIGINEGKFFNALLFTCFGIVVCQIAVPEYGQIIVPMMLLLVIFSYWGFMFLLQRHLEV